MGYRDLYGHDVEASLDANHFSRRVAASNKRLRRTHLNAVNKWADDLVRKNPSPAFRMDLGTGSGDKAHVSEMSRMKGDKNQAALTLQKLGVNPDSITL